MKSLGYANEHFDSFCLVLSRVQLKLSQNFHLCTLIMKSKWSSLSTVILPKEWTPQAFLQCNPQASSLLLYWQMKWTGTFMLSKPQALFFHVLSHRLGSKFHFHEHFSFVECKGYCRLWEHRGHILCMFLLSSNDTITIYRPNKLKKCFKD